MSAGFEKKKFSTNKISSLYFMAPERIMGELDLSKEFLMTKCDIWSIGVILYFLLFGELPFSGANVSKMIKQIKKCKFALKVDQDGWSSELIDLYDLITKMVVVDPSQRLNAA